MSEALHFIGCGNMSFVICLCAGCLTALAIDLHHLYGYVLCIQTLAILHLTRDTRAQHCLIPPYSSQTFPTCAKSSTAAFYTDLTHWPLEYAKECALNATSVYTAYTTQDKLLIQLVVAHSKQQTSTVKIVAVAKIITLHVHVGTSVLTVEPL